MEHLTHNIQCDVKKYWYDISCDNWYDMDKPYFIIALKNMQFMLIFKDKKLYKTIVPEFTKEKKYLLHYLNTWKLFVRS